MARGFTRRIDKELDKMIQEVMDREGISFREASREVAKTFKPKIRF